MAQAYQTQKTIIWTGKGPMPKELRLKSPYDQIEALRSRVFVILPLVVQNRTFGVWWRAGRVIGLLIRPQWSHSRSWRNKQRWLASTPGSMPLPNLS